MILTNYEKEKIIATAAAIATSLYCHEYVTGIDYISLAEEVAKAAIHALDDEQYAGLIFINTSRFTTWYTLTHYGNNQGRQYLKMYFSGVKFEHLSKYLWYPPEQKAAK